MRRPQSSVQRQSGMPREPIRQSAGGVPEGAVPMSLTHAPLAPQTVPAGQESGVHGGASGTQPVASALTTKPSSQTQPVPSGAGLELGGQPPPVEQTEAQLASHVELSFGTHDPSESQVPAQVCEAQSGQQIPPSTPSRPQQREPVGHSDEEPASAQALVARVMHTPCTQRPGWVAVPAHSASQSHVEPGARPVVGPASGRATSSRPPSSEIGPSSGRWSSSRGPESAVVSEGPGLGPGPGPGPASLLAHAATAASATRSEDRKTKLMVPPNEWKTNTQQP